MNIIIITGKLKEDITLKNNVAMGTIISDKEYYDLVAFGNNASELANFKKNQFVVIQGALSKRKYNDKYYYRIVVSSIELFGKTETPIDMVLDNSEIISDDTIVEANTDSIEVSDDELPF